MASIHSLLKVLAFCANLLPHTRAQVVFVVPEDLFCSATPGMIHDGLMAVTDPTCLLVNDQPGCNLFGLPDCRACALIPEAVADNTLPCELLNLFNLESDAVAQVPLKDGDCVDCEPLVPPPFQPGSSTDPVKPVETSYLAEPSEEGDYMPIVIVLPTDVFIEPESSVWTDSEGSDDGEDNVAEDSAEITRRLRTQLQLSIED